MVLVDVQMVMKCWFLAHMGFEWRGRKPGVAQEWGIEDLIDQGQRRCYSKMEIREWMRMVKWVHLIVGLQILVGLWWLD